MTAPHLRLDPISRLVACRDLEAAGVLAREILTRLLDDPAAVRLDVARAHRTLAEILLWDGKASDASPHVFESRRRYRPYRSEPKLAGEVDLMLVSHAYEDGRSFEGEQMLAGILSSCERVPSAQLVYARALRLAGHYEIVRGEFERGDALVQQALAATEQRTIDERTDDPAVAERHLLRSQYLFTAGEVAFMVEERARSIDLTRAALDMCETRFSDEKEYLAFARDRAAHAFRVVGEERLAEQVPGERTERSAS